MSGPSALHTLTALSLVANRTEPTAFTPSPEIYGRPAISFVKTTSQPLQRPSTVQLITIGNNVIDSHVHNFAMADDSPWRPQVRTPRRRPYTEGSNRSLGDYWKSWFGGDKTSSTENEAKAKRRSSVESNELVGPAANNLASASVRYGGGYGRPMAGRRPRPGGGRYKPFALDRIGKNLQVTQAHQR